MRATDYRMITFEGDLDEVTRKFNTWASNDDGIEIINIQFVPITFDTYANRHAVIVVYKGEVHKLRRIIPYMREKDPLTIFDPHIDKLDEEDDKATVEYAGDGNTTWRTEVKEENKK